MFLFFLRLVFLCGTATFRTVPSSEASCETARRLRREQTPAEQILWRHLRGKRMCNVKFRRQHPIGPYFVDFCSIERNLILEVDGGQHAEQPADDEARSSFLRSHGYRVLRFCRQRYTAKELHQFKIEYCTQKFSFSDQPVLHSLWSRG